MNNNSLVSIDDISRDEILQLIRVARHFEENPNSRLLDGKVVATLFFEPSTRTRLSFETAVNRLGGRVIGFSDASTSSSAKGETLKDTIKMVSNYVDLIVMRHHLEGAARYATEVTDVPVINAGDGANQHPSQTMLDLYSIEKTQGTLENLTITLVCDLKYGKEGKTVLSGENTFKLYDTYGFPMDLTIEILEEKDFTADEEGFRQAMEVQRQTAREAREVTNYMGADVTVYQSIDPAVESRFVGYDRLRHDSKVTVLTTSDAIVDELSEGMEGTVLVEETPFYATMGGQAADTGVISAEHGRFLVEDTIKLQGTKIGHVGKMVSGSLRTGENVTLEVEESRRNLTANNHSATHLMQKALRMVLGSHVEQAGSLVDKDKLRFDFTHFSPMTEEEISKVESIVNEEINKGLDVITSEMTLEEAKKTGAMALFGEKYGETVRVVQMGDFSSELCGGTHVENTRNISAFKIVSESGVAAGVRRIEALTGMGLIAYYNQVEKQLGEIAKVLKASPSEAVRKVMAMQEEIKTLSKENDKLKAKMAKAAAGDITSEATEISGIRVLIKQLADVDMNAMRDLGDEAKQKLGEAVVVFATEAGGKVNLMATATEGAIAKGAHAGNLIKEIAALVGGGGGGRPNMAQAGGKNPSGISEALEKAVEVVKSQLG